jgi:phosphatidylethanolamine-binding protein (PEBP) family uncharacterized protein
MMTVTALAEVREPLTSVHADDKPPELSGSVSPEHTQSFALLAFDKESPFGFRFTHRVLYDLLPEKRELPDDVPKQANFQTVPARGQMITKKGRRWTMSSSRSHHCVFTLYALDTKLGPPPAPKSRFQKAGKGNIVASGELIGGFEHQSEES